MYGPVTAVPIKAWFDPIFQLNIIIISIHEYQIQIKSLANLHLITFEVS